MFISLHVFMAWTFSNLFWYATHRTTAILWGFLITNKWWFAKSILKLKDTWEWGGGGGGAESCNCWRSSEKPFYSLSLTSWNTYTHTQKESLFLLTFLFFFKHENKSRHSVISWLLVNASHQLQNRGFEIGKGISLEAKEWPKTMIKGC